jgi:threonine dehydrogenase-like Zn-dependent dehydrogenase
VQAVVWHGRGDVRVEEVPDPVIEDSRDVIIKVTSAGICGSDVHLCEVLSPFMREGDVLGHEAIGIVLEAGSAITNLAPGDRVVVPLNVACGHCWMCRHGLMSQCETTQTHEYHKGGAMFGGSGLYGQVPGAQAEYLRVPFAGFGPIRVPEGPADDRFVYLSDVLPSAWQAVKYAHVPTGGSVAVLGLGPIGEMAARVAIKLGAGRVIGVDVVPERLARAESWGVETYNLSEFEDMAMVIREATGGRGPDAVIDAVGQEAHGSPAGQIAQKLTSFLPERWAAGLMQTVGDNRLAALHTSIDMVRRGGTVSVVGIYGGMSDPMPMMTMFDKQIQLRMGQANVLAWTDEILPLLLGEEDPLGVDDFATHHLPLSDAPKAYEALQSKEDGMIKTLLQP